MAHVYFRLHVVSTGPIESAQSTQLEGAVQPVKDAKEEVIGQQLFLTLISRRARRRRAAGLGMGNLKYHFVVFFNGNLKIFKNYPIFLHFVPFFTKKYNSAKK